MNLVSQNQLLVQCHTGGKCTYLHSISYLLLLQRQGLNFISIIYSPELVQNEHYNKKADIWAAGCVLYEMATLTPAFWSNNMLILAKKVQTLCDIEFAKS